MIKGAMYTTIITLYKQGRSQREISRVTKTDRKTVRKIWKGYINEKLEAPKRYKREMELDEWRGKITELLEKDLSYIRTHELLQEQGCKVSYASLTRYIRKHNIKQKTCIRFHTKAGEEAQVDFGEIGLQYDQLGKKRKAYVFNMRLSYSRLDYYEVIFDQKVATWVRCHINAFRYFGSVVKVVKLDNLKAGVLEANFYEPTYQKEYKRLAEHYNFWLSPCRTYQPQEKGKVESGIKFVKNNFFAGRKFDNYAILEMNLSKWFKKTNKRVHGTTRKIPMEVFELEERSEMMALPVEEFDLSSWYCRKVGKDCHITVKNNYYSVPSKYAFKEVMVQLTPQLIQIFNDNNELITCHIVAKGQGIHTTQESHYDKNKLYCPGFEQYDRKYEEKMKIIGSNCYAMLNFLKQKHQRDWYRVAKGIISLQKVYSNELIDKACARALSYGISSYKL